MNHTGKFTKTKYGKWRIYDLHVEHVYFPYTSSYGNILLNYQGYTSRCLGVLVFPVRLAHWHTCMWMHMTHQIHLPTTSTPDRLCLSVHQTISCSGKLCIYDLPMLIFHIVVETYCQFAREYIPRITISTGEMTTLIGFMAHVKALLLELVTVCCWFHSRDACRSSFVNAGPSSDLFGCKTGKISNQLIGRW